MARSEKIAGFIVTHHNCSSKGIRLERATRAAALLAARELLLNDHSVTIRICKPKNGRIYYAITASTGE